jgi:hypothetical protein
MFEISSEHRMTQIFPTLQAQGKKIFGKKAAQIFAPVDQNGDLTFGYIFARSVVPKLARKLTHVRGISNLVSLFSDNGDFMKAMTVPDAEIQTLLKKHSGVESTVNAEGGFVEILTGPAARYCGTVTQRNAQTGALTIDVAFPTGRHFVVIANDSCVKPLEQVPMKERNFWGIVKSEESDPQES